MNTSAWERPDIYFEDNERGYLKDEIKRKTEKFVFSAIRHYDIDKSSLFLFWEKEKIINNYLYEHWLNGKKYLSSDIANDIAETVYNGLENYIREEILSGKHVHTGIIRD